MGESRAVLFVQVEQVFFVMEGSVDSVLDLEYSYTLSTLEVSVFCFPNQTGPWLLWPHFTLGPAAHVWLQENVPAHRMERRK